MRHPGFETVRARPELLLDVDTEADLERARRILGAEGVKEKKVRGAGGP